MSVGYDHIDLSECHKRQLPVGYTPDVLTDATAELTVTLLLATARGMLQGIDAVKSGNWKTPDTMFNMGPSLLDSTVGIVGFGRIGSAVVQRLRPFGVRRFLCAGSKRPTATSAKTVTIGEYQDIEQVSFEELLRRSDYVIACCALNDQTRNLFSTDAFKLMKRNAVFINTSRGGVVDQNALHSSLMAGHICAAGLDVTTPEPLPVNSEMLKCANLIVLPHIGSATHHARNLMGELTARNILAALDGKPMPEQIK